MAYTASNIAKIRTELVFTLAARNIKLKYKNSLLGFFWSLLTPLLYLSIFSFIFNQAFPGIENYPLFALTGLIFWSYFGNSSNQVIASVVQSAGILRSVNVPTIVFPLAALFAELINLLLSLIPFGVIMYFFDFRPSLETLLILPVAAIFTCFVFGFSLLLCALNVYYRDIGILWNTLMPALFYFTPIAYSFQLIPQELRWVMNINPLFHFMELIRDVLYWGRFPEIERIAITGSLALVFLVLGLVVFKKLERGFISNY